MDSFTLLGLLKEKQIELQVADGKLLMKSLKRVDDELRRLIKDKRAELISILAGDDRLSKKIEESGNESLMYAATFSQKEIWVSHMTGNGRSFNIPHTFKISGAVDVSALTRAARLMVERHEALRTCFLELNGELFQKIISTDDPEFTLEYKDISTHHYAASIEEILERESSHVFDLDNTPLFRLLLIKISEAEFLLYFNVHHIIFDAASSEIFFSELNEFYHHYLNTENGQKENSPGFKTKSFRDYSSSMKRMVADGKLDDLSIFWANYFKDGLPQLKLLYDYRRHHRRSFSGQQYSTVIASEVTKQIRNYCKEHKITPFLFTITSLFLLFRKLTGQAEFVIGVPVSSRFQNGYQGVIGNFLNTVPIKLKVDDRKDFAWHSAQAFESYSSASRHSLMPMELLIDQLVENRDPGRHPLFDVMFVYNVHDSDRQEASSLEIEHLKKGRPGSKVDISVYVNDDVKDLTCTFSYSDELFLESTIKYWSDEYNLLLSSFIKNGKEPITEILHGNIAKTANDLENVQFLNSVLQLPGIEDL